MTSSFAPEDLIRIFTRRKIKLMKTHTKEAGGGVIYALEELMLQNAL